MSEKLTVILLSWKRHKNVSIIINSLLSTGIVSEVIVWNNNCKVEMKSKKSNVKIINSGENFKAYSRYAAAFLAQEKTILFQDDDYLFNPEDIVSLFNLYCKDKSRIYGFEGRDLVDGKYVVQPKYGEVDIVLGQFMIFSKDLLSEVYGKILKLTPFDRGDDIAFSLLANKKHMCVKVKKVNLDPNQSEALWRDPSHKSKRQLMIDRIMCCM
jgi:hypothetical protein